ncbi:unnamed protein product [Zymoseptoria tritici ST99CH_1E4]|uniref:Uncharacterized protein n=1 Tax=Zymoseptoria tritici ST99CH_1E4 TaxID=1276532 RepID=A0A2H1GY90_ZYMTR|nr:unnamed protein product [Zymoseptoria tritici ST99CH_1E4]
MADYTWDRPVLALWRGHWYRATQLNATTIKFDCPPGNDLRLNSYSNAEIRKYPQDIGGNPLKTAASDEPVQKGDNVLARVRTANHYHTSDMGYEMGSVLETSYRGKAADVLVEYQSGIKDVVTYDKICHMYLGGPTRLNSLAQGVYPRYHKPFVSAATHSEILVSTPSNSITAGPASRSNSDILSRQGSAPAFTGAGTRNGSIESDWRIIQRYSIEDLITVTRNYVDDPRFITNNPKSRKEYIMQVSLAFAKMHEDDKTSQAGVEFKRLWAQLVRHHHHSLSSSSRLWINGKLHKDWFAI